MANAMTRMTRASILAGSLLTAAFQAITPSPYLGQPVPGLTPVLFAPGIVSTEAIELNGVFAPDMREFFFTRIIDRTPTMFHSRLAGGAWTEPRPLMLYPGQARALAVDMSVSPDGLELFFHGNYRPSGSAADVTEGDIWRSRRLDGAWATAGMVPPPISSDANEVYTSVVRDGSLYFSSSRPGGPGRSNLYRAQRLPGGGFAEPVLVPSPVNSELGVGDSFVSPDETYVVFSSRRPPNLGSSDLFVAFRLPDGRWDEPVHLGRTVNTEQTDYCPFVTPDGKYFFFSRRDGAPLESTSGDVYWMDAAFLEQFKKQAEDRPAR